MGSYTYFSTSHILRHKKNSFSYMLYQQQDNHKAFLNYTQKAYIKVRRLYQNYLAKLHNDVNFKPNTNNKNLTNSKRDFLASLEVLADAVIEIVEVESGMLEAAGDEVFAYEDAAVFAIIDAITGLEHRTDAIIDY